MNAGNIKFDAVETTGGIGGALLSELMSGTPKFDVSANGENVWDVKVSGLTLKYVPQWNEFNPSLDREKHGYYAGVSIPKVLDGNIISQVKTSGRKADGTTTDKIWGGNSSATGYVGPISSLFTTTKSR